MQTALARLIERPATALAVEFVRNGDEETLATQIELTEIPAPPFGETARAERMASLLTAAGFGGVWSDDAGNVLALEPGTMGELPLVVSAHLDTVFPGDTDVRVRREGSLFRGPGISDDGRGLAALLAIARALHHAELRTTHPILFVATVGEEGIGDLRGVKHLFGSDGDGRAASGFISLDGAGLDRIVANGLGSRRYRVTVDGPGGHSWVDWGLANPIHALTEIGVELTGLELAREPVSTLTIARIGGGKSINAIPQGAWLEIDTRSALNDELDRLEASIRALVQRFAAQWTTLTFLTTVIGDRPGGATDSDTTLVRAALAATRSQGGEPVLATSSTDANIPMALGIPAVTLGCGGDAGQAHTTDEWYRNVRGPEGIIRALYTILLTAGIADPC